MNRISRIRILAICILTCIAAIIISGQTVRAAEDPKVMRTATIGSRVKVYVRGVEVTNDATYQIGQIPADTPRSYEISNDELPMRTLIMLDNSFSIPSASRGMINEALKGIVNAHGEMEQFRIATFSDTITYLSDRYSDDYTAINNMISTITYENQDTMLTDILYEVITDLNNEKYAGYTRIIIITDGVNNKPVGGVTLDRVKEILKSTPYPVYTIGANTGNNDELLDNLFSLSWLTNAEYLVLESSSIEDITSMTSKDAQISIYDAEIPEKTQTGGIQSSKLTLSDGTEIVFDVNLPFSIEENEEPEPVIEEEEAAVEAPVDVEEPIEQPSEPEKPVEPSKVIGIIMTMIGVAAAIIVILVIIRKNMTKKEKTADDSAPEYEKTDIIIENEDDFSDTVPLTPAEGMDGKRHYRLTLTDSADTERSFRCDLTDEIQIGRKPDNNIVISDDTTVHGHHSSITMKNNTFYITDLKDVKNHSSVNGIELKPEIPQLIVTNTKVTIGRHTYTINIVEV